MAEPLVAPLAPTYRRVTRLTGSWAGADVEDILTHGEDRGPGRRNRWLVVIAVIVVLGALAAKYLPHGRPAPAVHRPPPVAGSAAGSEQGQPPPAGDRAQTAGLPTEPDGVIGPLPRLAVGVKLPVAGKRPAWLWPASGRTMPIRGLPRAGTGYVFMRADGGWAVQSAEVAAPTCGECAGPPRPVYFIADHALGATPVGLANAVAPSATPCALWLTSYPPGARSPDAVGTAREVSASGRPLGPSVRLPAGYVIDRATSAGLLLSPVIRADGGAPYRLWQPRTGHTGRMFTSVLAASAHALAWTPSCAWQCRVRVLDLVTGRVTVIRLPAGEAAANALFSPDGRFLALQMSAGSGGDGGEIAMQLAVASLASGELTLVPGAWSSSDALVGFGWPEGDNNLVAEFSFTTKVQVTAWRPGATRLAVVALEPGENPTAIVVG